MPTPEKRKFIQDGDTSSSLLSPNKCKRNAHWQNKQDHLGGAPALEKDVVPNGCGAEVQPVEEGSGSQDYAVGNVEKLPSNQNPVTNLDPTKSHQNT